MQNLFFTIGHSTRPIDELVNLLRKIPALRCAPGAQPVSIDDILDALRALVRAPGPTDREW
jgi:hypothetical protein